MATVKEHDVQVSIRIPKAVFDRAEKLGTRLATFGVKRAAVLRLAIIRGLDVLERELSARKR